MCVCVRITIRVHQIHPVGSEAIVSPRRLNTNTFFEAIVAVPASNLQNVHFICKVKYRSWGGPVTVKEMVLNLKGIGQVLQHKA